MKKIILILTILIIAGCVIKPHVPDVQQGNVLDQTTVNKLSVGMTKDQVRAILGDPVLDNILDKTCWNYAYTNQHNGGKITSQHVTLYFDQNDRLTKIQSALTPCTIK
jgi:outer membrane protein assembly factor BamE